MKLIIMIFLIIFTFFSCLYNPFLKGDYTEESQPVNVLQSGTVTISSDSFNFVDLIDGEIVTSQITISNTTAVDYDWTVSDTYGWLQISDISGTVLSESQSVIDVTFDSSGEQGNNYSGDISIDVDTGKFTSTIPVAINVISNNRPAGVYTHLFGNGGGNPGIRWETLPVDVSLPIRMYYYTDDVDGDTISLGIDGWNYNEVPESINNLAVFEMTNGNASGNTFEIFLQNGAENQSIYIYKITWNNGSNQALAEVGGLIGDVNKSAFYTRP